MDRRKTLADVGIYLLLAFGISCVFYTVIIGGGGLAGGGGAGRYYITGLMWTPAVAALLTVWLRKIDLSTLGWGWGRWKWNWAGYLLPLLYVTAAYLMIWLFGLGGFADQANVDKIAGSLGWQGVDRTFVPIFYFLLLATVGIITSLGAALGEEIGWRGFLAPRLVGVAGFTAGSIVTGIIWASWHMPLLLGADYNGGTEWWYSLLCFSAMVLGISIVMTWLRLKSGSLWPCAILHAAHNLFLQGFFQPITGERGAATRYAGGEFGWAVALTVLIVSVYFWRRRHEVEAPAGAAVEARMAA